MKRRHFIALDTHCQFTEAVGVTERGRVTKKERCPTTIPDLLKFIESVPRPRWIVFEEGPLADWLWRNLTGSAEEITVCDPRRNHLIAKDSDKDDPIDAEKLAQLMRGGYLKAVHHAESLERAIFKQHVGLYHRSVRERVRKVNQLSGLLRRHGVFVGERAFAKPEQRAALLARLPSSAVLRKDLEWLWQGYDLAAKHVVRMRRQLVQLAREQEPIRRFIELPGMKWVRAATFYAYVDTPWRFAGKERLWKYVGLGLERRHSGAGPTKVRLCRQANRLLKGVILGAAKTAIGSEDNPFADQYRRWLEKGNTPRIARRNTARSLAATLWGMWKNGNAYHPEWVGVPAAAQAAIEVSSSADGCR